MPRDFKRYALGDITPMASLRAAWRLKQSNWMRQRIAPGPHTLGKRSVFILPTRQGIYLALFLLAMLLACINYNLSLGYLLTFFVFSVALGAMHRTHQNLLGTRIEALAIEPVFAGSAAWLTIRLDNPTQRIKQAMCVTFRGQALGSQMGITSMGNATSLLQLPAMPRGLHAAPALVLSSTYPLGLWRAWSYAFPTVTITVYPEPQSPLPHFAPLPQRANTAKPIARVQGTQGDAVSHIDAVEIAAIKNIYWPAMAKGLLAQRVLDDDTPQAHGVLLSLAGCTLVGVEAQLSQLCFAIAHCQAAQMPFVMQLQGVYFPPSIQASVDPAHIRQCLQALAAYA
jgi:hypothetical protein